MAVVARNGSASRWMRLKMYSNAVCSTVCWRRWSTMWPPYPTMAATEQGRPPERRESPGATGPERPARQGAEPRVEVERASVGGAGGKDAESEVEVAEIHRAWLRGGIAGGLAPETPEERRQRD